MIAVTNSAVDSCWTARRAAIAGMTVRYGRSVKPSTIQATTHATTSSGEPGTGWNTASWAMTSMIPMSPPRAAPRKLMVRITGPRLAAIRQQRRSPSRRGARLDRRARQPSTRARRSAAMGRGFASPATAGGIESRWRAARRAWLRAPRAGSPRRRRACPDPRSAGRRLPARSPARTRGAPPRAAAGRGPATGRSSPSSPTSPTATVRASMGGHEATTRGPARRRGRGPARRRSRRRRDSRRRRGSRVPRRRAGRARRAGARAASGRCRSARRAGVP